MIARLLMIGGVYLGEESDLLPANEANVDGYFENQRLLAINERIMRSLGGDWDHPPTPTAGWEAGEDFDLERVRARRLADELDHGGAWGWKDPRNCVTLPFWTALFPDLTTVLCVRNPLEVAVSLRRRNGFSYEKGLQLWRTYNERLLEALPGHRYLVADYEAFFQHPRREIDRLYDFVGLTPSAEQVAAAVAIVSSRMRHSAFTDEHVIDVGGPAAMAALYSRLRAEAMLPAGRVGALIETGADGDLDGDDRPAAVGGGQREVLQVSVIEVELARREIEQVRAERGAHEAALAERDRQIETLRAEVNAAGERIAELERLVADRDQQLATLTEQRADAARQIDHYQQQAISASRSIADLRAQLDLTRLQVKVADQSREYLLRRTN
jgi:hypothetical protein